jgi:nucleoside-diphosphate-sugar epimerase
MDVLITGAFGNVGVSVLSEALRRGYQVTVFELKNKKNMALKRKYEKEVKEIILGDLRNKADVDRAVAGKDVVIHMAAILPPLSEALDTVCMDVNVKGTSNIINAIKGNKKKTALVFTSSCSVMGRSLNRVPPVNIDHIADPVDNYTKSKIEAERLIRKSGLDLFCIGRLGAVMPTRGWFSMKTLAYGFEFPYHSRLEIVLDTDVALALVMAAESLTTDRKVNKKTFFISGGKECRLYYGTFFNTLLSTIGITPVKKECFAVDKPSFLDWLDTQEIQKILGYQKHTFLDYCELFKRKMRWLIPITTLFGNIISKIFMNMSPYYKIRKAGTTGDLKR